MGKIILYSTETCHRCKAIKQILNVNNINYEEVLDINTMKNKNFKEVPMMEIDDKILDYMDIMMWFKENNYSLFGGGNK